MIRLSRPNISSFAINQMASVLHSGNLVQGEKVAEFESSLQAYLDIGNVVAVSSGTAALHLSLLSLNIGPGDAVIVPDFTFPATANAVAMTGARPVLVDVDLESFLLTELALTEAIRCFNGPEKLKAVMPVHEFGLPCNMDAIVDVAHEHGLFVIEDAACALGARENEKAIGHSGAMSCFSFHPRKVLTTGEGGAIATNNDALAARLRSLRNHGIVRTGGGVAFTEPGLNCRMTEFQAVLGLDQLPNLDNWLDRRRQLAALYHETLSSLSEKFDVILPTATSGRSWQTYMVVIPSGMDRNNVIKQLREKGIETNLGAQCLSELELYGEALKFNNPGNASVLYNYGLALPLYEQLEEQDIRQVCAELHSVLMKEAGTNAVP